MASAQRALMEAHQEIARLREAVAKIERINDDLRKQLAASDKAVRDHFERER